MPIRSSDPFFWRHYEGPIILVCVRWYLHQSLQEPFTQESLGEKIRHVLGPRDTESDDSSRGRRSGAVSEDPILLPWDEQKTYPLTRSSVIRNAPEGSGVSSAVARCSRFFSEQ